MAAALLRKFLKTPFWAVYAALAALFLLLGAWAGIATAGRISAGSLPRGEKAQEASQSAALPANGQRNLLVIGVDGLDRDGPRLESLWLVLYFPGRSPVTLMPLYPRTAQVGASRGAALVETFSLDRSGDPNPAFFEHLRREQVWWNGYVLLDETALSALFDRLGGVDVEGHRLDGAQALAAIPRAQDDQARALQGQVRLLRSACAQAGKDSSGWLEIVGLAGSMGRHLRTDVDVAAWVQDWLQAAGQGPSLECEFPLQDAAW